MANWFYSLDAGVQDAILVIGIAAMTNVACGALGLLPGAAADEPVGRRAVACGAPGPGCGVCRGGQHEHCFHVCRPHWPWVYSRPS